MPAATLSHAERQRHLHMLFFCAFALAMSPLLAVREDDQVAVRLLPSVILPPTCASRAWFGISCPGCGLTRSWVHLAAGDVAASFRSHRLGWLIMAAAVFQIPYRIALLKGHRRFEVAGVVSTTFAIVTVAALFVNWFLLMLGY